MDVRRSNTIFFFFWSKKVSSQFCLDIYFPVLSANLTVPTTVPFIPNVLKTKANSLGWYVYSRAHQIYSPTLFLIIIFFFGSNI